MAPTDEFDPWVATQGLPDDFDLTIRESYFTFDADYNNGETLVWKVEGTTDDDDIGEFTGFWPCGAGWETKDKGQTASREDGKRKGFNKQSGYGSFFTAAIECGAGDLLKSRGTPFEAKVWIGLTFHLNRVEHDFGGEIGKRERLMPTAFKGEGGKGAAQAAPAGAPAAASTPAAAPAPASVADEAPPSNGEVVGGLSVPLRAKLKQLARNCATHDDFIEQAYTIDGVDGNAAAEDAVIDPNGIYAEAHPA